MNGLQYKNIIQWTTANTTVTDSLTGVKAIFNNMGVAFPNGTCEDVLKTLMTGEYMGWEACTAEQAQELANQGTAVVGVNTARAVVIMPDDRVEGIVDKEQVAAMAVETASAASAATLAADTAVVQTVPYASTVSDISATDRMTMQFYSYSSASVLTWGYYADLVLSVARSFLGKTETQIEAQTGFVLSNGLWCVDFVRMCCDEAGVYHANENIKATSSSSGLRDWFRDYKPSQYHVGTSGIQAGDIVFTIHPTDATLAAHTCFAASGVRSNNTVETINGNWTDGKVAVYSHPISEIGWYAHPNYYF